MLKRTVALAVALVIISVLPALGEVRNPDPVQDPFGCNSPGVLCSPLIGQGTNCPVMIITTYTDAAGHCRVRTCSLQSADVYSDGTVICNYGCTTAYCVIA